MAHSFRIVASCTADSNADYVPSPQPPELPNVVPDRVEQNVKSKFEAVLPDQETPLSEVTDPETGLTYCSGRYRFDEIDKKSDILAEIEKEVVNDCEWYRIEFHECTHDKGGGACDYDQVVSEKGTVPDEV